MTEDELLTKAVTWVWGEYANELDEIRSVSRKSLLELVKFVKDEVTIPEEPVSDYLEKDVEIAREEMVEKVTNYLNSKLYDWVQISHFGRREYPDTIMKRDFIYDLKQAMKDE